jgi:hypothetical protein
MSGLDAPMIVYVHGVGNKWQPEILQAEWDLALFGRDMRAASRMAYWPTCATGGHSLTRLASRSH